MDELLNLKHSLPHAKLVVGNSEIGIEMKFKHAGYSDLIDVNHVPELNKVCFVPHVFQMNSIWTPTSLLCIISRFPY